MGGVRLTGYERARKLRDLELKLGDLGNVGEGWEIGVGAALSVGRVGLGRKGGRGKLEVVRALKREGGKVFV